MAFSWRKIRPSRTLRDQFLMTLSRGAKIFLRYLEIENKWLTRECYPPLSARSQGLALLHWSGFETVSLQSRSHSKCTCAGAALSPKVLEQASSVWTSLPVSVCSTTKQFHSLTHCRTPCRLCGILTWKSYRPNEWIDRQQCRFGWSCSGVARRCSPLMKTRNSVKKNVCWLYCPVSQ